MTRENAYQAIAAVEGAATNLVVATCREMELEDNRALVKDAGIKRLMASGVATSVTGAEKVIELDVEYMAHRAAQREAVADRIFAQGKLEAAKLRARLAVEIWAQDAAAEPEEIE